MCTTAIEDQTEAEKVFMPVIFIYFEQTFININFNYYYHNISLVSSSFSFFPPSFFFEISYFMLFVDLKIMGSIEFIENKRLLVLPYDVQKTEKELKHSNLDICMWKTQIDRKHFFSNVLCCF